MKKYTIALLITFCLLAINLHKTYAQDKWVPVVDTIHITEAKLVDSSIIPMLDSAFTFLRLPSLAFGPHYYSLYIHKDTPAIRPFCDISLFVKDYLFAEQFEVEVFNGYDKLLFNYKGVQIIVKYNIKNNDTFALQYFKPTTHKGNYYHYHKIDKSRPERIFEPDQQYIQHVRFLVGKGYMTFLGYQLTIDENF